MLGPDAESEPVDREAVVGGSDLLSVEGVLEEPHDVANPLIWALERHAVPAFDDEWLDDPMPMANRPGAASDIEATVWASTPGLRV